MIELKNTRFGDLEFDEQDIINLAEGLLGFPLSQRFVLFPYGEDSPFFWLQSVDEPEVAFLVVNPFQFFADLEYAIGDEEVAGLQLADSDDAEIFTLVTIPEGRPEEMRTNLAGPVLVNVANRQGKQLLIKTYSARQPLVPDPLKETFRTEAEKNRSRRMRDGR